MIKVAWLAAFLIFSGFTNFAGWAHHSCTHTYEYINPNNDVTTNFNDHITSHQWLDRHDLPQHKKTTTQTLIYQQLYQWSNMSNNHNIHQWHNLLAFFTLFILPLQCAYILYNIYPTTFTTCHTSHWYTHMLLKKWSTLSTMKPLAYKRPLLTMTTTLLIYILLRHSRLS